MTKILLKLLENLYFFGKDIRMFEYLCWEQTLCILTKICIKRMPETTMCLLNGSIQTLQRGGPQKNNNPIITAGFNFNNVR